MDFLCTIHYVALGGHWNTFPFVLKIFLVVYLVDWGFDLCFKFRFNPCLLCVLQIRRSLLNEDEYGFRRAKRPIYYDEGLEVITF